MNEREAKRRLCKGLADNGVFDALMDRLLDSVFLADPECDPGYVARVQESGRVETIDHILQDAIPDFRAALEGLLAAKGTTRRPTRPRRRYDTQPEAKARYEALLLFLEEALCDQDMMRVRWIKRRRPSLSEPAIRDQYNHLRAEMIEQMDRHYTEGVGIAFWEVEAKSLEPFEDFRKFIKERARDLHMSQMRLFPDHDQIYKTWKARGGYRYKNRQSFLQAAKDARRFAHKVRTL